MPFDLDQLNYDFTQLDLPSLYLTISHYRHRPILAIPLPHNPAAPTLNNWVADIDHDAVFFNANTPPVLQSHSQLEMLAHILLGHRPLTIPSVATSDFDPFTVRPTFTPAEAAAAYTLALRIGLRVYTWPRLTLKQLTALNWLRQRLEQFFASNEPLPLYSEALPDEAALPAYAQLIAILTAKFRYQTAVHPMSLPDLHPATPYFKQLMPIHDDDDPNYLLLAYSRVAQRLHITSVQTPQRGVSTDSQQEKES